VQYAMNDVFTRIAHE